MWFPKHTFISKSGAEYIDLIFDSIGIPLAFVRFLEPFVLQEFKADMGRFFRYIGNLLGMRREAKKRKRVSFANEPLCSFVNSAMNIEFVYLILLSINNFMDNRARMDEERMTLR